MTVILRYYWTFKDKVCPFNTLYTNIYWILGMCTLQLKYKHVHAKCGVKLPPAIKKLQIQFLWKKNQNIVNYVRRYEENL